MTLLIAIIVGAVAFLFTVGLGASAQDVRRRDFSTFIVVLIVCALLWCVSAYLFYAAGAA